VKIAAASSELPILQPEDLSAADFTAKLSAYKPDIGVVVAYRILPREVFSIPAKGCVNLHPSMLPDLRGAAPINWALIRGYRQSGISTFLIRERVDTGSILLQETVNIFLEDNAGSLSKRLSIRGGELIVESLDQIATGKLEPEPQKGTTTRAPKITDETRRISWKLPAEEIHNLVRGLSPSPCAYTYVGSKRLKIYSSNFRTGSAQLKPGTVMDLADNSLNISTGEGIFGIEELQLEGRRRMTAEEFQRGSSITAGTVLGE